jgi:hypothetical protein
VAVVACVAPFVVVPEGAGATRSVFPSDGVHSDFNSDGFSDLAIGVPNEDVGDVFDAGAVEVIAPASGTRSRPWTSLGARSPRGDAA